MPISRTRRRRGGGSSRGARSAASLSLTRPRKTKTNKFYLAGAILIAVLVIGSFGLTTIPFGSGGISGTGNSQVYVDGVGEQQNITGNTHVDEGVSVSYSSYPPTSGDHWPPGEQARCGFYEGGFEDERAVHNLEHGNIVVNYNLATQEEVDQLRDIMGTIGLANAWGVTRSYDERPDDLPVGQIALTAWGIIDTMVGIDPDRIDRFFEAYAGTIGPESVPCLG